MQTFIPHLFFQHTAGFAGSATLSCMGLGAAGPSGTQGQGQCTLSIAGFPSTVRTQPQWSTAFFLGIFVAHILTD